MDGNIVKRSYMKMKELLCVFEYFFARKNIFLYYNHNY